MLWFSSQTLEELVDYSRKSIKQNTRTRELEENTNKHTHNTLLYISFLFDPCQSTPSAQRGSSLYYNDLKEKLNIFSLFLINGHTPHMHNHFTESYKCDREHLRKLHEVTLQAIYKKVESRFPYSLSHNQLLMFYLPNTSFLP